jgi:hypothetical protein
MVALEMDTNDGYKTTKANQLQKGQTGIGSREPNQRNPNQLFDLAISNCNNTRVIYIYMCERAGGLHLNCFGSCHCTFKWSDGRMDGGDDRGTADHSSHRSSLATHPPSPGCTGAGH